MIEWLSPLNSCKSEEIARVALAHGINDIRTIGPKFRVPCVSSKLNCDASLSLPVRT
jgi:hypothetical protein